MEYIHLETATKKPENRGTADTPFEDFDSDPNDDLKFGPSQRTMFAPVVELPDNVFNPVLKREVALFTQDVNNIKRPGAYSPSTGEWEIGYVLQDLTLEQSKGAKLGILREQYDAALAAGYTTGPYKFPFTEDFFRSLNTRQRFLSEAIAAGAVPGTREITFSDVTGKEVSVNLTTLTNQFINYGVAYLSIFEKEVKARDQINTATTPAEVDAVTWTF